MDLQLAVPLTADELLTRLDAAIEVAAEKVIRERLANEQVISLQEAVRMTPWTVSGFKRVATKENLAAVKGPHKSPPGYRRGDVIAMLQAMRVWPHGKPTELKAVA